MTETEIVRRFNRLRDHCSHPDGSREPDGCCKDCGQQGLFAACAAAVSDPVAVPDKPMPAPPRQYVQTTLWGN